MRRLTLCAAAASAALLLAGCAGTGGFGSRAVQSSAVFASGELTLSAPQGYCVDKRMLRQSPHEGFALLVQCGEPRRLFQAEDPAVITATIGKAAAGARAPAAADLARMVPGARITDSRDDMLLPLVRFDLPGHQAAGASSTHWRGAFIYNGHLVSLALYAPEGSANLRVRGAMLLNELAGRTLEASASAGREPGAPGGNALRPRARPRAAATAERSAKPRLRDRIAGLFH
ncbi:hypothetical protein ACUXV3_12805 [Roseobacteraceae bacterium NS-SX3]